MTNLADTHVACAYQYTVDSYVLTRTQTHFKIAVNIKRHVTLLGFPCFECIFINALAFQSQKSSAKNSRSEVTHKACIVKMAHV